MSNAKSVETFKDKEKYYLTNETFTEIQPIDMPNERNIQNYHSTYNNIRDWLGYQKAGEEKAKSTIN
ncbi:TPA: hypothetical protein ACPIZ7_000530 [Haemophilus influenzae]|uniref:type I restriction endonuclease subunit R, EcoR124 family n=1 Tax=Haemophilus TaxID=724 RepID=UPI001C5B58D8|nr:MULTISPECIES: hypothetical protein [Haemophilus]MBZ5692906.1 hypothetical protein [Haemophilus influenzae]MCK8791171.1 hypothetical protein [Haemophilus influenzae]MCK8803891.1 hypothetical protein [Haemophilus influenzae]MCK8806186.1 hypothetical protein [Haemophilus influenzae]MCK8811114.1 hypothetical protein [Haemophilus influenzae]